eukprot:6202363-Pleurochrysis_carterae.AAC.1
MKRNKAPKVPTHRRLPSLAAGLHDPRRQKKDGRAEAAGGGRDITCIQNTRFHSARTKSTSATWSQISFSWRSSERQTSMSVSWNGASSKSTCRALSVRASASRLRKTRCSRWSSA